MSDMTQAVPQLAAAPMPAAAPPPMLAAAPPSAPSPVPAAGTAAELPPVPNYSMRREVRPSQDGPAEHLIVTYGTPAQSIVVKPLNLGEQWDLAEVTGANAGNDTFQNMAYTAASVMQFGDVPVMPPRFNRNNLRTVLTRLGLDGLRAVSRALSEASGPSAAPADQAAALATAGN